MTEHQCSAVRWFTQRADRRVLLKASAALAAMSALPASSWLSNASAQDAPETLSGYFSEVLQGDFTAAATGPKEFQADIAFTAIAPHWAGTAPEGGQVSFSLSFDGETWGDPVTVGVAEDGRGDDRDGRYFAQLVVAGGEQFVRYETLDASGNATTLPDLVFTYIDSTAGPTTADVDSGFSTAAVTSPTIISRAAWGCNEALTHEDENPSKPLIWPAEYETVKHVIIHHSVTTNKQDPIVAIRAIYYYHAITRGWGDIGYNYLVDYLGNVYEGRFGGENVVAGHAFQYNHGSAGICAMGTFSSVDVTPEAQAGLIWITAWAGRNLDPLGESFFIDTDNVPTICGHRDVLDTDCPGDVLWSDLPFIRVSVKDVLDGVTEPGIPGAYKDGDRIVVTTEGANLRSSPTTGASIVASLSTGTKGTVTDGPVSADGYTWYEISTASYTGWMASFLFEKDSSTPTGKFNIGDTVKVSTDNLNLRSSASTGASIVATMPNGTTGTVQDGPASGSGYTWYKLSTTYGTGWAVQDYLVKSTPSKPPGQFAKGDVVYVNDNDVALRSAAGTSKSLIATMNKGTKLTITYAYNRANGFEWYKVTGPYGAGWVAGAYLSSTPVTNVKPIKIGFTVYVNDGPLNMRSSPSTSASIVNVLPTDAKLQVADGPRTANGYTWWKLRSSKWGTGWVVANYIGRR